METFKHAIHVILNIIDKIGPTLATLMAVYLAYLYTKKQKYLENKDVEYKKIRIATSNLLQIWRELSMIEFYINSEKFFAELIFRNPRIAASYFNIDLKRIKGFKRLFNESKEEIKPFNVLLFYNLENSFMDFNKSFRFFDLEENVQPYGENSKEVLKGMLKEVVRDLENIIKNTAEHLPAKEKKEIDQLIQDHHESLKKTNIDYEVPKFLIDLFNNAAPINEPITADEIALFTNDDTVKLILNKAAPIVFELFQNQSPMDYINMVDSLLTNPEQFLTNTFNLQEALMRIKITEDEYQMFINNKTLYKMICGIYSKFSSPVPIDFKRFLLNINNGTINIRQEFENQKILLMQTEHR